MTLSVTALSFMVFYGGNINLIMCHFSQKQALTPDRGEGLMNQALSRPPSLG